MRTNPRTGERLVPTNSKSELTQALRVVVRYIAHELTLIDFSSRKGLVRAKELGAAIRAIKTIKIRMSSGSRRHTVTAAKS